MIGDARDLPLPITLLRRWWWLLLLSVLVSLGAAYGVTRGIPPTYEADTQLYVNTQSVSSSIGSYTDRASSLMLASTVAQMIVSHRVADRAVHLAGLAVTPEQLLSEMTVTAAGETPIVHIQVEDRQARRAAALANAVAAAIIAVNRADQSVRFGDLERTIREQIASTTRTLDRDTARLRHLSAARTVTPAARAEITSLSQRLNVLQAGLSSLSQQLDSILLSQAQSATTLTVIDTAQVPASPMQPSLRKDLLVGLIIGLFLAGAVIALMHYLDDPLPSPQAVEARLGVPVLAGIPRNRSSERPLVAADASGGRAADAFTLLRATLLARASAAGARSILVASGGAGEGKSTIAANLAVAAARAGQRVALVDADLRRPSLHTLFDLAPAPGLADFLGGTESLEGVLRTTRVDGVLLVCCGQLPSNPPDLLALSRMGEFLAAATSAADLVILDSPPALLVGDAMTLASQVGGVLLVLDDDLTTMRAATRTLRLLQLAGGSPLGAVINRLHATTPGYGAAAYAAYMRQPRAGLAPSGNELAADSAAMTGHTG